MLDADTLYGLIRLLLILMIGGVLAAAGYWYLNDPYDTETETVEARIVFERYQATANVRRGRTGSYDGLCEDLLLPNDITCDASSERYALETQLRDGSFMCADSTGAIVTHIYSKQNDQVCPL